MNAAETETAPPTSARPAWGLPRRILTTIAAVVLVGLMVRQISITLEQSPRPAGFFRGVLQGALMPVALPNLIVGDDVTIYAQQNNGVPYKLGYTVGVNLCGAFFFGMFFLRLSRWQKWRARSRTPNSTNPP
jgi:hypothetical protein